MMTRTKESRGTDDQEQSAVAKPGSNAIQKRGSKEPSSLVRDLDIFWGNYLKFNLTSEALECNLCVEP